MSNMGLASRVSSLQSEMSRAQRELNRIQGINNELRSEIGTITSGMDSADNTLNNYNEQIRGSLHNSNNVMENSVNTVLQAYEMQGEIQRLYRLYKNMETAHKKIHECNNKRYYDFKSYRVVRKLVQGLMDNLDFSFVNGNAITRAVEVQHLQSPDYWLTCALLSIMAWMNNDKELATRALDRAMRLDSKTSSIFFMVFNLRLERYDAAKKWFYEYQQCQLKGSDKSTFLLLFALISDSLTTEADFETKKVIGEYLQNNLLQYTTRQGYGDEAIQIIANHIAGLQTESAPGYSLLQRHCSQYNVMVGVLKKAETNKKFLEYLRSVKNVSTAEKNDFIKVFVDELVALPSENEKDLEDQIKFNELIIKNKGEVDRAREQYEAQKEYRQDDLNPFREMIDLLYSSNEEEIMPQMHRNLLVFSRSLHEQAVVMFRQAYRAQISHVKAIAIDDYSAEVSFGNLPSAQAQVANFYQAKAENEKAQVKDWVAYGVIAAGVAIGIASFFTSLFLLIGTLAAGVAGVLLIKSNEKKRAQIDAECFKKAQITTGVLGQLFAEYKLYYEQVDYFDKFGDQVLDELSSL